MMHFPLFQIPPISKKIQSSTKIWNFPLFSLFQYISRCFAKIIIPPYFSKFPHCFVKCTCFFYILYVCFVPPALTMMHLCITQCTYWTSLVMVEAEENIH